MKKRSLVTRVGQSLSLALLVNGLLACSQDSTAELERSKVLTPGDVSGLTTVSKDDLSSPDSAMVPQRSNVLTPNDIAGLTTISRDGFSAFVSVVGELELTVMDFTEAMPLDPPPEGWWHRVVLDRAPMDLSFEIIGDDHALRMATNNSASMLLRFVDVDLERYPLLSWRWLIEDPVITDQDEQTPAGDDHPARLFIRFSNVENVNRVLEVIWGNELLTGSYKYIADLPHYVANGGMDVVGEWFDEEINLLGIYQELWPQDEGIPRITEIGLSADSDATNDDSLAWISYVHLKQKLIPPSP